MEFINQHLRKSLEALISNPSPLFAEVFNSARNQYKGQYEPILKYLDVILNDTGFCDNKDLNVLHLHFEDDLNDSIAEAISEYILIRCHREHLMDDSQSEQVNPLIIAIKQFLKSKLKKLEICPDGASGKNGGNRAYKNWIAEQDETEKLSQFYKNYNDKSRATSKTVFNCQIKTSSALETVFKTQPFAINVGKYNSDFSYCFLNSGKSLNELDLFPNLVDSLKTIILFDCERKRFMTNFSLEELIKWNNEYGANFKKLLIVTFGKETSSLKDIRSKIEIVRDRFKIPIGAAYTILASELNILLNYNENPQISVEFVGFENSAFWDSFLLETNIRELYELRSVKMMNVYALCFNLEIKKYILDDLFSNAESKLITDGTKQALKDLSLEGLNTIKEALNNAMNLVINSGLKEKIVTKTEPDTVMVMADAMMKDDGLKIKVLAALNLNKGNRVISWSEVMDITTKPILILSYRDQGKPPYYFYPNIVESFSMNENISGIFLNFLFGSQYNLAKYYFDRDFHRILNHGIRIKYFSWNNLGEAIQKMRPPSKLGMNSNWEYEYSNSESRESYKIKLVNQKPKIYGSSDLFIIRNAEESRYKVDKLSSLNSKEIKDETFLLQNLEEIQEDINIYEQILNTEQQEEELKIIQKQFDVRGENTGRLWKIQLKKLADTKGEAVLYDELKDFLAVKKLGMVSFFHFKSTWINPQSESIAPLSKRIFIELCEFLGIPKIYFVIVQRIRNASKQSSRQSTTQMNRFLRDLFNDGCFNEGVNSRSIISNRLSYYRKNHPLDELGIGENYLLDNLVTLIELIRPELKLLKVEYIEKIES